MNGFTWEELRKLKKGWDSYNGDPPSFKAINKAENFVKLCKKFNLEPDHIGAGRGIGITFNRKDGREVNIEICDKDGRSCMLLEHGDEEKTWQTFVDRDMYLEDFIPIILKFLNSC